MNNWLTSCKEVQLRVCHKSPKPVLFSSKCLDGRTLSHIPDSDRFVLCSTDNKFVLWVEENTGDIVEMPTACVDLPRFIVTHPPQLDLSVISTRYDEWQSRMK